GHGSSTNMLRRGEVGLAERKVVHLLAGRLQLARLGGHGNRGRRLKRLDDAGSSEGHDRCFLKKGSACARRPAGGFVPGAARARGRETSKKRATNPDGVRQS